jgi:hypothetical protein
MTFETASKYLKALEHDPSLAILPLQMVADHRGVTRAAIDRMVRIGQLEEIRIEKTRYVRASSLLAIRHEFERKVAVVRSYLEKAARQGETCVFYEPVMSLVGLSPGVPADRSAIGAILGRVSEITWALPKKDRHLLSVIVHRKTPGITRPGPGFLALAEYLHENEGLPSWKDEDDLIERETRRVLGFYGRSEDWPE